MRGQRRTFVHAVVHPKFTDDAREALDELTLDQRARVNLIEGDAAAMDLGLSGQELRSLAGEIDRIHHMAQVSYLGADKKLADQVNIRGAREIIEVATMKGGNHWMEIRTIAPQSRRARRRAAG